MDKFSTFLKQNIEVRSKVWLEEDGKTVTGRSADTDTLAASARAYVSALNKLMVKREKSAPATMVTP